MRLEILFWDCRCSIIYWLNFAIPFFGIFFDTLWYEGKIKTEIGIRFGEKMFRKGW